VRADFGAQRKAAQGFFRAVLSWAKDAIEVPEMDEGSTSLILAVVDAFAATESEPGVMAHPVATPPASLLLYAHAEAI
jgi:hypothetical protein